MKALVTGGGGFLGSRVAVMLHERGDDVRVLGRGTYPHHDEAGIPTIRADVRDADAVAQACEGVDAVFHVAAITNLWGKRSLFRAINVDGTRNVIEACRRARVPKLVYTSSPSVVFGREDLRGVNESQPYPPRYLAAYPATKAEAERMVLAANGPDLATVALRPHLVWGVGDPHLIPRVIARAKEGRLVRVGDGTNLVDITHVDNAAGAHLSAVDALDFGAPCAGRAYFLSQGEPVALWPWLNDVLDAAGAPRVTRSIPYKVAFALGAVLEAGYFVAGSNGEPRMTRFMASQLAKTHYFDISAAKRDIGFEVRVSTSDGLDDLFASFRAP